MTLTEFLSRLDGVQKAGTGFTALCPAHGDTRPSLTIGEGRKPGALVVHCHRGCSMPAILKAMKLRTRDLYSINPPPPMPARPVGTSTRRSPAPAQRAPLGTMTAAYYYGFNFDEHGHGDPTSAVCRFEQTVLTPEGPKIVKTFLQARWDVAEHRWIKGLLDTTPRVLYRLPELMRDRPRSIVIVEGEKDVETIRGLGHPATTNPGGAGPGKWKSIFSKQLHDAGVRAAILWPDADDVGRAHMLAVATSLKAYGIECRWIHAPGYKDASDWAAAGHTAADLADLLMKATDAP